MTERCEIVLCPKSQNGAASLLLELVDEVKHICYPHTLVAVKDVEGAYEGESLDAEEIRRRICESIGQLEAKRQLLIDLRSKTLHIAGSGQESRNEVCDDNMERFEADRLMEDAESFNELAEAVQALYSLGIEIDLDVF